MEEELSVELRPAFQWTCPDCGVDHFESVWVLEGSEEDLAAAREDLGIEPWEPGEVVMAPPRVICSECKMFFGTRDFREEEED